MMKQRILVVDDSAVNLRLYLRLLEQDDYDLLTATSGGETLDLARGEHPIDLILLDVKLPDIDGIEVCRQLKNDPNTSEIPIVLISAVRTDEDSIRLGMEMGADGYLTQPVEDIALRAWVKATLRIRLLQRKLTEQLQDSSGGGSEVMGQFAKLSHDVNNPLQALFAAADMLSFELPPESPARKLVDEIFTHAEGVAAIVAQASVRAREQLEDVRS